MIRLAAGASGFFTLIQSGDRPDRYGRSLRMATMVEPGNKARIMPRTGLSQSANLVERKSAGNW
jgi:hypothetical protein